MSVSVEYRTLTYPRFSAIAIVRSERENCSYLVGKVLVCGEETYSLTEDTEETYGKVSVSLEQLMMEHAVRLELVLIHAQSNRQSQPDGERGTNVRVRPRIRVLGVRKPETEQDEARCEERIADKVKFRHLFREGELLQLPLGWAVGKDADGPRGEEEGHADVEEVAEAVRVAATVEAAADDEAAKESQGVGHHDDGLGPAPPRPGQNLGHDRMKQRLHAECGADEAAAGDEHVHAGGEGRDQRSERPREAEAHEEPLAAPVVGSLADYGPKHDGEDGHRPGEP